MSLYRIWTTSLPKCVISPKNGTPKLEELSLYKDGEILAQILRKTAHSFFSNMFYRGVLFIEKDELELSFKIFKNISEETWGYSEKECVPPLHRLELSYITYAFFLENGIGCVRNFELAYFYYKKAYKILDKKRLTWYIKNNKDALNHLNDILVFCDKRISSFEGKEFLL